MGNLKKSKKNKNKNKKQKQKQKINPINLINLVLDLIQLLMQRMFQEEQRLSLN